MRSVLLDLDGTITDPAPGIVGGFLYALDRLGVPAPPAASLTWVIGPPLRKAFPKLLPVGVDVEDAVRLYREYYGGGGLYEAIVYEGMREAIAAIRASVDRLYVCTSKPTHFAGPIIAHFDLAARFDGIFGAELDGRFDDKGELIAHMVATLGIDPGASVMVGDRASDGLAAARNRMPAIGVTWGYGSAEELAIPSFVTLCRRPDELPDAVARALTTGSTRAGMSATPR